MTAQPEEFLITFGPAKLSPENEKLFQAILRRWRLEEKSPNLYRRVQ